jgi:hypothetical protein
VTIGEIDPSLAGLDDDVLVRRLHAMDEWDGLVTNDKRILRMPEAVVTVDELIAAYENPSRESD